MNTTETIGNAQELPAFFYEGSLYCEDCLPLDCEEETLIHISEKRKGEYFCVECKKLYTTLQEENPLELKEEEEEEEEEETTIDPELEEFEEEFEEEEEEEEKAPKKEIKPKAPRKTVLKLLRINVKPKEAPTPKKTIKNLFNEWGW